MTERGGTGGGGFVQCTIVQAFGPGEFARILVPSRCIKQKKLHT